MNYCENCKRCGDFSDRKCPHCKSKKVRAPQDDDLVLISEADFVQRTAFAEALEQAGVDFVVAPIAQANYLPGISGSAARLFGVYCPYRQRESALQTLAQIAAADPDATE